MAVCVCQWNNWYKLKAHKWEINRHILDSFSLDSLLKRDFVSYFAWSTWDLGPCLLAGSYKSSHSQKKQWTFSAKQDEPNPSPAEISGTLFYRGWGGGQDHVCYTPPDKNAHEEAPVSLVRHTPRSVSCTCASFCIVLRPNTVCGGIFHC